VHYEELAPMLLKELQQQERRIDAQAEQNSEQARTIAAQAMEVRDLKQQISKVNDLEQKLSEMRTALAALSKDQRVAQR